MKPVSILTRTRALIALGMSAGLLVNQPVAATGKPPAANERKKNEEGEKPARKTARSSKTISSRNNSSVKIFPDVLRREMHVVAKENEGRQIDFYVFDLEGTMVQNYKMKEKDHIRIAGLARGKYVYRVFSGDLETAHGYFEIR